MKADNPKMGAIEENPAKAADEVLISDTVLKKVVWEQIKRFGYDLFAGIPTMLATATNISVQSECVMGPGDTIVMQLFGKDNEMHQLIIDRERPIVLGVVAVGGLW